MANNKATGKKARHAPELAQRARYQILKALDLLEEEGTSIAELLAKEAIENPVRIMELVSKFCPKDINGTLEHTGNIEHSHRSISETDRFIESVIGQDSASTKSSTH